MSALRRIPLAVALALCPPGPQAAGNETNGLAELAPTEALQGHASKREAAAAASPRLRLLGWQNTEGYAVSASRARDLLFGEFAAQLAPEADALELRDRQRLRSGAELLRFRVRRQDVEIFGEGLALLFDAQGRARALSGGARGGDGTPPAGRWRLDARAAAAAALADYGFDAPSLASNLLPSRQAGPYTQLRAPALFSRSRAGWWIEGEPRARRLWLRRAGSLRPVWYVETAAAAEHAVSEHFAHFIDAESGALLQRLSLHTHMQVRYQAYADPDGLLRPLPGPQGRLDHPHPSGQPDGFDPPLSPPGTVSLAYAPLAAWWPQAGFKDAWLAPGDAQTRGNNIDAYADLAPPDGFSAGDRRADMTAPQAFEPGYRLDLEPDHDAEQISAGVVNAFYLGNYLHDWFYAAGFDEAAGNAQQDNYGRGGEAGDPLLIETLDHSGNDNASMITPADGASPKMQLRPFRGPVQAHLKPPAPEPELSVQTASFGAPAFAIRAGLVSGRDGVGADLDGCQPLLDKPVGRIVLLEDGGCPPTDKARNAQTAGAAGLLVASTGPGYPNLRGSAADVVLPVLGVDAAGYAQLRALMSRSVPQVEMQAIVQPRRDSAMDTAIVAHEWGHYISNRLIGNAAGLSNHQGRSLGEGWADFHALLLLVRAEDALSPAGAGFAGTYGVMNFVSAGLFPSWSPQSHYFGIRRYPYSTRRSANPLSFRMISAGTVLPANVPRTTASVSPDTASVHNAGELWASALWDCYAALLRDTLSDPSTGSAPRFDFFEAQRRMAEYLVAGYKLTPMAPTYTEARDALLAAMAVSDARDLELCGIAFAGRGMGQRARAPARQSLSLSNIVESFVEGGDLQVRTVELIEDQGCDHDGVLDPGERGRLRVTLRNSGTRALADSSLAVSSTSLRIGLPAGDQRTLAPSEPLQQQVAEFEVSLEDGRREAIIFELLPDDPAIPFDTGEPAKAEFAISFDIRHFVSRSDDFGAPELAWSTEFDAGLEPELVQWRREMLDALTASVRGPDFAEPGRSWLISPELDVGTLSDFVVEFEARHGFEGVTGEHFDGGVIEVSRDGGASWEDVESLAKMEPGYGGVLSECCDNPLGGRRAFVGRSEGWPQAFVTHRIDFGRLLGGQRVRLRFGVATDAAVGAPGWTLRSVRMRGILNTPFPAIVEDAGACTLDGSFSDGFEGDPP
jgi:large repetitive protein